MGALRKTGAVLKFITVLLPAATTLGGLSTFVGLHISSMVKYDNATSQFSETAQFQDIKNEQIAKIDAKKDFITSEEYDTLIKNVESNGFLNEAMEVNYIEDENIRNLYKQGKKEDETALYFCIPLFGGMIASIAYVSDTFREFIDIKHNMRDNIFEEEEKKRKKELKRREKEESFYKEEVLNR